MSPSSAADGAAPWQLSLAFSNRREELPGVIAAIESFATDRCLGERDRFVLNLVVDELTTNVVEHSRMEPGQQPIELRVRIVQGRLELELEDGGQEFDPLALPAPSLDAPLEQRAIGGLGIHLVRQTVDDIRYQRRGDRNRVSVSCRLQPPDAH